MNIFFCIHFKYKTKKVSDNIKKIVNFQNLPTIEFFWRLSFEILIIHEPSLGSCKVQHKIWALSVLAVSTFIGFKQTDRQASKVYERYFFMVAYDLLFNKAKIHTQGYWYPGRECGQAVCRGDKLLLYTPQGIWREGGGRHCLCSGQIFINNYNVVSSILKLRL